MHPAVAVASSDAAWSQFRADVTTACTAKAKTLVSDPIVLVDAHGSESYGIALIYGRTTAPHGTAQLPGLTSVVCVYDKRTKKVEVSGPMRTEFTNP
jgi:hypothetical protein